MVPNIEQDFILLLGYSIQYQEYNLTRFNHRKTLLKWGYRDLNLSSKPYTTNPTPFTPSPEYNPKPSKPLTLCAYKHHNEILGFQV